MKLLLLSFSISFLSFSQNEGRYQIYSKKANPNSINFPQRELYLSSFIQNSKIKSFTQQVKNKKGTSIRQQVVFNKNGHKEKIIIHGDTSFYFYQNDSVLSKVITTGKIERKMLYSYQNGKITSIQTFSKGKLVSLSMREYNNANKLVSELFQKGKKMKSSYLLKYVYEGNKLQKQLFYTNGELTNTWDYSCGEQGKKIEHKNAVSICEYEEGNNDGSYIKYKRRLRGEYVSLSKHYFSKDSVLYKTEQIGPNNRVYREVLITKDTTIRTRFDSKGRVTQRQISAFDAAKKVRSVETINGIKQNKSRAYLTYYNDYGLVNKNENIYKGKTTLVLTYDYEFY